MYKNLNCQALGVSGRQSELIELALTYGFSGMSLEIEHFAKQVELRGLDRAKRFFDSAKIKLGSFKLPIRWQAGDEVYREDLKKLKRIAECAAALNAWSCYTNVMPVGYDRPYHENFEFHRQRLTEIGDMLAPFGIRVGLDFLPCVHQREEGQYQFIYSAEPLILLVKTIGLPNVGVVVDVWNWHVGGHTVELLKELPREQVVEVRLADIAADADLATVQTTDRLLPGAGGTIDCRSVLRRLAMVDYQGPVTPMPSPRQFSGRTRDQIVAAAGEAMDTLWKEVGLNSEGHLIEAEV